MSQAETLFGFLRRTAERHPELEAVVFPGGRVRYAELHERSAAMASGLSARGITAGTRVAVFVRPSPELIAIVYALFAIGAVPVLIDPGMGRAALVRCLHSMQPAALIGVPKAQILRWIAPAALEHARLFVCVGGWFPGAISLQSLERAGRGTSSGAVPRSEDTAAILFTSGSTGPAKGVVYTHGNFLAQVEALRSLYGLGPGQRDLCCFPLFALFNAAFERTSVFAPLDPSRPASVDPEALLTTLQRESITDTFGSPAIWKRVVPHARRNGTRLPALRRAMIAGASVPPALIEQFHALLEDDADVHTPYGATEALPVASASGRELVAQRTRIEGGHGICVGRAAPGTRIAIIPIHDQPITHWQSEWEGAHGRLGEIAVQGPVVTSAYAGMELATRAAKIPDASGAWHRMGDVGYFDAEGLLWFTGRKSQRLETAQGTYLPEPLERVIETLPSIRRSALVGAGPRGAEEPLLIVEGRAGDEHAILAHAQAAAARALPHPLPRVERVLFHPHFPVDVRHNAKIRREELKLWAEERLR
jgi:acyl-CoA synthetase (AMP-forming)/AMP-acid ligase II